MFLVVPAAMYALPHLTGYSYGKYGSSFRQLLWEGGGWRFLLLVWILGGLAGLAAHVFTPRTAQKR
jgi:hypothetical protein